MRALLVKLRPPKNLNCTSRVSIPAWRVSPSRSERDRVTSCVDVLLCSFLSHGRWSKSETTRDQNIPGMCGATLPYFLPIITYDHLDLRPAMPHASSEAAEDPAEVCWPVLYAPRACRCRWGAEARSACAYATEPIASRAAAYAW